jgi:hypothetical protein
MLTQQPFDLRPDWQTCPHRSQVYSLAYVPGGISCLDCGTLLDQSIPFGPEHVGYVTADWQWHLDGKGWTTQDAPRRAGRYS